MIVTGLAITLLGLWIVAASLGFAVDEQLALILVLTIAGLSLLVGALVAALRRRNA
jgi:uncharacterized membrane protein